MPYTVSRLKNSICYRCRRLFNPLAKRTDNSYTTHIPILVAIGLLTNIKDVLELGCGENSTLTFLNKTAFPELIHLQSIENDYVWADKISALVGSDHRYQITLVQGDIKLAIDQSLVKGKDLIFIDDSLTAQKRAATIKEVSKRVDASTIVIIHDYENTEYRNAAKGFAHSFRFTAFNPNTGILWNDDNLHRKQLFRLNSFFKKNQSLELADPLSWHEKINKFLKAEV